MANADPPRQAPTREQVAWLIKHRRGQLGKVLRDKYLFYQARLARQMFGLAHGIELAENVRLQKNGSLFAEAPNAKISVGENSVIFENAAIEAYGSGHICIGANSVLGDLRISCRHSITLGANCLSSWNVLIQDFDPHPIEPAQRAQQVTDIVNSFKPRFKSGTPHKEHSNWDFPGEAISIGENVWIGANVLVLKGAQIGSGCVLAAGAVVLGGAYPENHLIAGNPAKAVKPL